MAASAPLPHPWLLSRLSGVGQTSLRFYQMGASKIHSEFHQSCTKLKDSTTIPSPLGIRADNLMAEVCLSKWEEAAGGGGG